MASQPLNPFDYAERFNPATRRKRVATDPIAATLESIQQEDVHQTIVQGGDPDATAKVTRVAREANAPPALIEDRLADVEKAQRAERMRQVLGDYPAFGRWASQNPRGAVAASDDHEALGLLGKAWGSLKAGGNEAAASLSDLWRSIDEIIVPIANPSGARDILDRERAESASYRARAEAQRPKGGGFVERSLLQGLESVPTSLTALAVGTLTRSPNAAAGVMGAMSAAPAYQKARGQGVGVGSSLTYAIQQGGTEALTERIPAGKLIEAIAAKTPFGKTLVKQLGEELKGENIATVVQDLSDWAMLPENQNKTFGDYLKARPEAALQTSLATISGTTAQTGIAVATDRAVRASVNVAGRVADANQARGEARFIDRATKASEQSKLKARDPEAYRSLVQAQAEEAGTTHIHIDGQAAQAYFQSDSFDPDSDPFTRYADQVEEAAATGGDVSIPIQDALTDLVGTPAWEALKPDMRMTPGGMSAREAQTFEDAIDDVMADLTDEMAAREKGDLATRTKLEKLTDSIAEKFASAGLTAPDARTVASLVAARAQTRSERLGWDLTGHEYDNLDVRQVLPEGAVQTNDEGKVEVAPELVKAIKASAKRGPSLIDFLIKRGGIEDVGGDFASMGAAKIKGVARKGQRKLIRDRADRQANMLGGDYNNDNTPDALFSAAISEGYFPELLGLTQQDDAQAAPDIGVFMDAIARGLAGEHTYSATNRSELDGAAAELRDMLEEAGYDTAKMKDAEIADALSQMWQRDAREGFEQGLFDEPEQPKQTMTQSQRATLEALQKQGMIRRGGQKPISDQEGGLFDAARDQKSFFQAAYHGSPHIFDKFSLDAIGTGEGAQAYGWGLYFAGRKEIADFYREALTDHQWNTGALIGIDGQRLTDLDAFKAMPEASQKDVRLVLNASLESEADVADAILQFEDFRQRVVNASGDKQSARFNPAERFLRSIEGAALSELPPPRMGRTYKVDIPEDDEYLLWDKPLSEQPEKVKAAIAKMKGDGKEAEDMSDDELFAALGGYEQTFGDKEKTGQGFYKEVSADMARKAGRIDLDEGNGWGAANPEVHYDDRAASEFLHSLGIAGIKYLDGGSRSAGDGSYNYVVFDDSRVSIQAYEQSYGEGPRGRIIFDQNKAIIELFRARNLSTPLHELSHLWLEELRFDASLPDAPKQVKDDWQTVQDWFAANGHPLDAQGNIPVEAHELWARSGERYLMEGKAPSTALQRLFETFRGWLTAIYRTVDSLRAPISPEIREVFDRLLATDEEIAQARERQNIAALFTEAAGLMPQPEFEAYQRQVADARADANGKMLDKTMAAVRRKVKKDWNEERTRLMAEKAEALDTLPLYRAIKQLGETPISAQWLKDEGFDAGALPKRVPPLVRDTGSDPQLAAELSGYATAREMIEALIDAERAHRQAKEGGDPRSMRVRAIETSADEEMARRHGDPFSDGSIEREALGLVHGEMQGEVFATELRVLSRKTGKRATPYSLAKDWARNRVRQGVVRDEASPSAIQRYARAASKAGKAAQDAMLKQDFDEAFRQKSFQMLNNALVSEAKAANDEIEAAVKRLAKVAKARTMKSVDQDYLEQAQALLEQVDIRPRSQVSIDRQGKWAEWAQAREAEGFDVVVPASFEATLRTTHYTRLSVETLLGLDAAIKQVMHLGRLKQELLDNQERREFDAVVKEAQAGAGNVKGPPPTGLKDPTWRDWLRSGAAAVDTSLLKLETVFDWLDGGDSNGVFNRIAFRPIATAQAREQDMLKDYYARIKALFEAMPDVGKWAAKVQTPFTDPFTGELFTPTRQRIIAMALNIGNAGNSQRLADGYGWNEGAIRDFLVDELTAEEWAFVQGVWDTVDTLWPEIAKLERKINGVEPDKVEATEIVTPHGTFRGGYYPAIYDTSLDRMADRQAQESANALFEPNAVRATTRASSTKDRAEKVSRPILLDLGVINRHLGEVIHDITHREAVMQAWKFLSDNRVQSAVDAALGREVTNMFRPWVKFVANSWAMERAGNEGFGKFVGKLRANATAVGLGLRATTMVTQIAGYSNSTEVIGERWMAEGMARVAEAPVATTNFVLARSDEVRHRLDTLDRDIRTELARINATNPLSKAYARRDEAKAFLFHGIGLADRMVVVPTWIGAYNKALSEGMEEADAAFYADKVVRQSQGAGGPKDLAAIQRGTGKWGEALKLMTMFYSYFSAQYQRQRTLYRDATGADVRRPRNMPRLAARAFWLVVLPPLLTEILRMGVGAPAGPEDDEWWAQWLLRKLLANSLGSIPLARDVFEPSWNAAAGNRYFAPSVSPIQRSLESLVNSAGDVGKIARGDETKHATKDFLETAGYATGLVPGQLASATQFLVDVGNGDADPQGFSDWVEGLSTGKLKDD